MNDWDRPRLRWLLASAAGAGIFCADLSTELGVAAAVPYIAVVWIAFTTGNRRSVWVAAAACSLLTLAGLIFSPRGGETWKAVVNRSLALFAVWATAYLCLRVLQLVEQLNRRAFEADQTALKLVRQREDEEHRILALASMSEDLRLERQLLISTENRFRATVEAALDAVITIDEQGVVVDWNPQAETTFGWPRGEAVGQMLAEMIVPPQFRDAHTKGLAEFRATGAGPVLNQRLELTSLRRSGEEFPVELTILPLQFTEGHQFCAFVRDISKRKRLEEDQRQLNEELERRVKERTAELGEAIEALEQSNEELQQFAYVASHDLQTPLRGIAGFAQFLQQDYQGRLDEKAEGYLGRIVDGAKRLQALINDLLAFSRVESRAAPFKPVSLNEVFDDVLALLHASIGDADAEVTRNDLPVVAGDRSQLSQLLQNLIGNSLKYRGDEPPRIRVSADYNDEVCMITVRDNGIGIDAKHHERIFEIFRRLHTSQRYPGTGIGLAICRRIVHRHGGQIWLESEDGQGSAFFFTIAMCVR